MLQPTTPIEVFCSYAPADEPRCRELEKHLSLLHRQSVMATWPYRRRGDLGLMRAMHEQR